MLDGHDEEEQAARAAVELAEPDQSSEWAAFAEEVRAGRAAPTILVTRPGAQANEFADLLVDAGYKPVLAPMLLVGPGDADGVRRALADLQTGGFDWVVFSSGNAPLGVAATDPASPFAEDPGRALAGVRVAAVGPGTAARLLDLGVKADLVAERSDAAGLVEALARQGVWRQRIWLPQAELARPELVEGLRALGADVTATIAYRVAPPRFIGIPERRMILEGGIHAVAFASPSAADHLVELLGPDRAALESIPTVCIGQTTAARVRELGLTAGAIADEPSDAGMVAALNRLFPAIPGSVDRGPDAPDDLPDPYGSAEPDQLGDPL